MNPEQLFTGRPLQTRDATAASPTIPTKVYVKQSWGQIWVEVPDLIPLMLNWSTAESSIGTAQFLHRYGERIAPDTEDNKYALLPFVDYTNYWVKVVVSETAEEKLKRYWVGRIEAQAIQPLGEGSQQAGRSIMIANSAESIFARYVVLSSLAVELNDAGLEVPFEVENGLTFNLGGFPNRSKSETYPYRFTPYTNSEQYPYSYNFNVTDWSTRDIVQYAIANWIPKESDGTPGPTVNWTNNITRLPYWDRPEIPTHGQSALEILRQVVSHRRMYMWWLQYLPNDTFDFRVNTMTPVTIQSKWEFDGLVGGVPANQEKIDIRAMGDPSVTANIEQDALGAVQQVICQGAKRRNVFTIEFTSPTLEFGDRSHLGEAKWTLAAEKAYKTGVTTETAYTDIASAELSKRREIIDEYRARDVFKDVYQRFGLRTDADTQYPPGDPDNYRMFRDNLVLLSDTFLPAMQTFSIADYVWTGSAVQVVTTGENNFGTLGKGSSDYVEIAGSTYESLNGRWEVNIDSTTEFTLVEKSSVSFQPVLTSSLTALATGGVVFEPVYPWEKKDNNPVLSTMVFFPLPGETPAEDRFVLLDRMNTTLQKVQDSKQRTISAAIYVDGYSPTFTMRISGEKKQIIAQGTKSAEGNENQYGDPNYGVFEPIENIEEVLPPGTEEGKLDWRKMKATVCLEDERYCEGRWPLEVDLEDLYPFESTIRQLYFNAGDDYKLDWVAPDTMFDIDANGDLVAFPEGFYQNDGYRLTDLAERMHAWYGQVRAVLRLRGDYVYPVTDPDDINSFLGIQLGVMVEKFRNDQSEETLSTLYHTINTPITSITVQFPYIEAEYPAPELGRPQIDITTASGQLDPQFLLNI